MKQLLDSCKVEEGVEQPFEKSWLVKYHEMMTQEEKTKANEKNSN